MHKGVLPIGGMGKRTSKLRRLIVESIGFCINPGLDFLLFPIPLLPFIVALCNRWHLHIGRHWMEAVKPKLSTGWLTHWPLFIEIK